MKDNGKSITSYLVKLVITGLLFGVISTPYTHAAVNTDQKIDVMLVVDSSGSMNNSDKNKVANEAMKMFIDMISVQGDKIGVVAFTDQIVREKALLQIDTPEDKKDLKKFIDQVARGSYTDIAVGVSEAVKILEKDREPGHFPMIVLLADGNNSLQGGRTQAQSDKELQAAIKKAQDIGIPMYTIGLNADGKLNKEVLESIANETNGKSFVTSTADDLPQILSEIFADQLKLKVIPLTGIVANGSYQDVTITIPNANVIEANISMMSNKAVEVKLFDPTGQERKIPSADVIYSKSNAYSLVKLLKPAMGDWKLQVKGVNKDKIDINLIFNYDVQLAMKPLPAGQSYAPGDQVDVQAQLESNGQPIVDPDLYKGMQSTLIVTDMDTMQAVESPLNNSGTEFTGSFEIADDHDYEVKIKVEDASFSRESPAVTISAKGSPAQPTAAASAAPAPIPAAPEEEKEPLPWGLIIAGAAILILLIIALLFILSRVKQANKGFYGQFIIEIRDEDTGERTSPQYKKLLGFKGKIKLHQLLQLSPEFAETDKIIFTPGKDSVFLQNLTGCVIEKSGRVFDAAKGKELKNNDRIKITLQKVNKSILMDYII